MSPLFADLSTWAFSCNCALKASSWLNKPNRCWTLFSPLSFFAFNLKINQNLLAVRHLIYSSIKGKIYMQAIFFFHTTPYSSQCLYITPQFMQVLFSSGFLFYPIPSHPFGQQNSPISAGCFENCIKHIEAFFLYTHIFLNMIPSSH